MAGACEVRGGAPHDAAQAGGIVDHRPGFLLLPLARAVGRRGWSAGWAILNAVRLLSRDGVAFVSSMELDIYLFYRRQIIETAPELGDTTPADYRDIVDAELSRRS